MRKHSDEKHPDSPGSPADYVAEVTKTFRDSMSRQVSEGVHIRRCPDNILNTKLEWHQPSLWKVRSELVRK